MTMQPLRPKQPTASLPPILSLCLISAPDQWVLVVSTAILRVRPTVIKPPLIDPCGGEEPFECSKRS
jgi:hypothetical protein